MESNRYIITKQLIKQNAQTLVIEYPYVNQRKQVFPQEARITYLTDDTAELHVLARPSRRYGNAGF